MRTSVSWINVDLLFALQFWLEYSCTRVHFVWLGFRFCGCYVLHMAKLCFVSLVRYPKQQKVDW